MTTQQNAFDYYMNMYKQGSVYVWGFNSGTIISGESIANAYKSFKSTKYNKAYYDTKLKEGAGKNGSDCSGAHYGISGYDTTAQGYYNRCTKKGSITSIPKDKLVLVFAGNSVSSINHTGVYMGNGMGMVFHMKSSAANAVYEPLASYNWKWWGYADFISDYETFRFGTAEWNNTEWIQRLQKTFGVAADGSFGAKSLAASVLVSKERNHRHACVSLLQEKLNYLGYNCGAVDGIFGTNTYNAVTAFQEKSGLAVDGIVGKNTWSRLVSA